MNRTLLAFAALALAACGGNKGPVSSGGGSGGGTGGGSGGGGSSGYTIGGTVNGLAGTLVLEDNLSDDLVLTSDGSFQFNSTAIDYSVTIKNQPSMQTCVVSNPSGVATSNITDITVTCSTNGYTIGGTVSGLVGTLVLQDNIASGPDVLTLTANGSFEFDSKAVAYSVAIQSQPSTQNCAIANGAGTATANVTNIEVACTSPLNLAPSDCTLLGTGNPYNPAGANYGGEAAGFALYRLQTDGTSVYWYDYNPNGGATGGSIFSVPVDGGSTVVVASGLAAVNAVAIDSTSVYWAEHDFASGYGSIKSSPKSGGAATLLAFSSSDANPPPGSTLPVFFPSGITTDTNNVYWSDALGGGTLRRVAKDGGTVTDISTNVGGSWLELDSNTDPTTIYYANGGGGAGTTEPAVFYSMPIDGGVPTTLATITGAYDVIGFGVDSSKLYAADTSSPGSIFSVNVDGGFTTIVSNLIDPQQVAFDSSSLYYVDNSGDTGGAYALARLPKDGGSPTYYPYCNPPGGAAAPAFYPVIYLAVDSTNIYVGGYYTQGSNPPYAILKMPLSSTYGVH